MKNTWEEVFSSLDVSRDGTIDLAEFKSIFHVFGVKPSDEELKGFMRDMGDRNGVTLPKFLDYIALAETGDPMSEMTMFWSVINPKLKPVVSVTELCNLLSAVGNISGDQANEMIERHDRQRKGGLNYDEFVAMLTAGPMDL